MVYPRRASGNHTKIVEKVLAEEELTVLGWRVVPVQPNILGVQARENHQIEQVLVAS